MDGFAGTGRWGYNTVSKKKEAIHQKDLGEYNQLKTETATQLKYLNERIDSIQRNVCTQLADFIKCS